MYLGWSGEHACGDEVVDLDGGLGHGVPERLHIFIKVLQLLVDHGAKNSANLTLLF